MRVYKITYQVKKDEDEMNSPATVKTSIIWAGSERESAGYRKLARQENGFLPNSCQTEMIDIPSGKAGLLKFLNSL